MTLSCLVTKASLDNTGSLNSSGMGMRNFGGQAKRSRPAAYVKPDTGSRCSVNTRQMFSPQGMEGVAPPDATTSSVVKASTAHPSVSSCPPMPTSADQAASTRRPDEMLIEHTITRLSDMRLTEMSEAYSSQKERPNIHEL